MNEMIARALTARFDELVSGGLLTVSAGLVKTLSTDAFSGDGKQTQTLPVPYNLTSTEPDDWRILLPDPTKAGIVFFEDGGYSSKPIGGMSQLRARLTLVCWFNGAKINGVTRERLMPILLSKLYSHRRRISTTDTELSALQVLGYSQGTVDPFQKYSAYDSLFNFRASPYGWLALDLSLMAYTSSECLVTTF